MFDVYLKDAYEIYMQALSQTENEASKRLHRASIFTSISAIESYVNYVSSSFIEAKTFTLYEEAFLADKRISFDQGEVVLKTEFYYLEHKIRFLLNKFNPNYDLKSKHWQWFIEVKQFRNELIHPKENEDIYDKEKYEVMAKNGLSGIINTINEVNKAIYKKPIRAQLLDLIP